jgi:hypothetical protein
LIVVQSIGAIGVVLNIEALENYLSFVSGQFWLACFLQNYLSPYRFDALIYAMESHLRPTRVTYFNGALHILLAQRRPGMNVGIFGAQNITEAAALMEGAIRYKGFKSHQQNINPQANACSINSGCL